MALGRFAGFFVVLLFLTEACSSSTIRSVDSEPSAPPRRIAGPREGTCDLIGTVSKEVLLVPLPGASDAFNKYDGQRVRVRGHLVLEFESTRIVNVKKRRWLAIALDKLQVETDEQILRCHLKPVEIQGHVVRLGGRGGPVWAVRAEGIVGL